VLLDRRRFLVSVLPRPPLHTEFKVEMIESAMTHAEMFIRQPESWRPDHNTENDQLIPVPKRPDLKILASVKFGVLWMRFVSYLDEQGVDSGRYAGNPNQFYAKVSRWVTKTKSSVMWYHPNRQLLRVWETEIKEEK
jgi:hypothetical protein